jgi:hypothetical protein
MPAIAIPTRKQTQPTRDAQQHPVGAGHARDSNAGQKTTTKPTRDAKQQPVGAGHARDQTYKRSIELMATGSFRI